jgi:hypothetical protein
MPVKGGPNIRTSQAIVWLDAADKSSYPGTGTTWINSVTPGTYNGTLTNTSFNSTDALGALFFSGSNTFADMGNIGAISASYTFQVAVKPLPTGSPYTILSYTSGSGTGSVTFRLDYSSSIQTAVFSAFASSGSVNKTYSLSTTIPTGSWSILHGKFGGAALALFKNGSIVSTTLITGSTVGYSTNNRFLVGGISQFTGSYLSGSIGNVAVYNASISSYFIATNYNGLATRFGLPTIVTPTFDQDIQAFIEATGITNPTEISAITNLVTDLKTYSIWDKMKAIYPFVGGTATSHKYNLKNPQDTDAAFRLIFNGGWIHSSTGALPNGTNASADTNLDLITMNSINDISYGYYSRTNSQSAGSFGWGVPTSINNEFWIRYTGGGDKYGYLFDNANDGGSAGGDCRGFNAMSRIASNIKYIQKNNSISTYSSVSSGTLSSRNFYFSRGSQGYEDRENAFGFIGNGLTDTELLNLYTAVQTFQTTLGRQV